MSITSSDLKFYSPVNVPEDDTSTTGGGISTAQRPTLTQLSANSVIAAVSDGADTRVLTVTGRGTNGSVTTENITLNGTTEVVGTTTFERVLKVSITADANRTVTIKQGSGGPTIGTIGPNETLLHIFFQRSASESAAVSRYEKLFIKNTHASLNLLNAKVTLTSDPAAKIQIGVAGSLDDTDSVTNRKTAPTGITFVDDNVAQNVPTGDLPAGSAVGVWVKQDLAANDPAQKSTFTVQINGETI